MTLFLKLNDRTKANKLASTYELWCILTSGLPAAALSVSCNKQFPHSVFSRLFFLDVSAATVGYCCEHENDPHGTKTVEHYSAFCHAPQKDPIGCKLVIKYAKLQKLSDLISSFTDVRLTTNHTIISKETC